MKTRPCVMVSFDYDAPPGWHVNEVKAILDEVLAERIPHLNPKSVAVSA